MRSGAPAVIGVFGLVGSSLAVLAGCSSGGGAMVTMMTMMTPDAGGLDDHLTASLAIPPGMTVTIPAGAKIVAGPGVVITVRGVLLVSAGAQAHASIATAAPHPEQAAAWGGIVVESGGRLDVDGLDLAGAKAALTVNVGSLGARYDNGTITDATVPFQIAKGGRLDTAHANVVNAGGSSGINGELHASYLDYAGTGYDGGIVMSDASSILDVTDSTFHGSAIGGYDYIVSYASTLIHIAYSTITDAHCAFHFNDVARFEIDHVTAGASSPGGAGGQVFWGAMLYGSGAGPNVISNSNFLGSDHDLDQQDANGPLTVTNTYTTGKDSILPTTTWLPADVASAPIADAKPR
jgi:hypothetical protein